MSNLQKRAYKYIDSITQEQYERWTSFGVMYAPEKSDSAFYITSAKVREAYRAACSNLLGMWISTEKQEMRDMMLTELCLITEYNPFQHMDVETPLHARR